MTPPRQQAQSLIETASPIETAAKAPSARIPLLAFVADGETETALQNRLAELSLGGCVVMRGGLAKAIRYLSSERSPDTLIVDISGVDLPLPELHKLAEVCEPRVTVIAIGDHNDVDLYRDVIQAGVSEYIVKPVTRQLLAQALAPKTAPAASVAIEHKLGRMIAFVGARGGVGTTTLATNLAWYLANRQKRRVGLLDLDLQTGDCALALNVKPTPGLREALLSPLRVDAVFLERAMAVLGERLFVLSSEEPLGSEIRFAAEAVEKVIAVLRGLVHYVVVDVPRIPAPAYRRALDLADLRVIVADQTLHAVRDAVRLGALLGEGDAEHWNLLAINRSGEGGRRAVSLGEIGNVAKLQPKSVIPYEPKLFARAVSKGQLAAEGRGRMADAIAALGFELTGRRPERSRWWRRGS
jgi:pilus assembly protein CpaE